jgi:hypothetical protein
MFSFKNASTKSLKFTTCSFAAGFGLTLFTAFIFKEDPPACVISNDKDNVLFIGIENPLSILVRGIPSETITVTSSGSGIVLQKKEDYHYTAWVTTPGETTITVSDGGKFTRTFPFRSKRIPDPDIQLGNCKKSLLIDPKLFRVQDKLIANARNTEADFKCDIVSFDVSKYGPKQEGATLTNIGPQFNPKVQQLIQKAKSEDTYYFDNVKARCPGDILSRELGSYVFQIK